MVFFFRAKYVVSVERSFLYLIYVSASFSLEPLNHVVRYDCSLWSITTETKSCQ